MSRNITASDGGSIWIRGDEHGIRILIFGRDNVAHDMIELTPAEAGKVRKAIDTAIAKANDGFRHEVELAQAHLRGIALRMGWSR